MADERNSKYAKLPKVELHVHLDGACRLSTLRDLSNQYNLSYPHDSMEEFQKVISIPKAVSSLSEFLKVFIARSNILCTEEAIERMAYEFCEDSAAQNVVYAECRFNPITGIPTNPSPDEYVQAVLAGLERGQKEFGVKMRVILCFMREKPESCMEIVHLADKYRSRGVVGVDIAGDELLTLDKRHVEGFRKARQLGLHITVHAAESGPAANVQQAIEELGAERIGHGYHVVEDERHYELAKRKGVHFEVCPSSSVFTNSATFDKHPVKRFAADGVSFSLNSDDPSVIECDLTGEYDLAATQLGLSTQQLVQSVRNAAKATFLPTDEKEELLKTLEEKLAQFEKDLK